MREILLNEKSLDGQFENMEDFYQTLPVMSRNLKILRENNVVLQKHSTLYQCKITKEIPLMDLQNRKGLVESVQRYQDGRIRTCYLNIESESVDELEKSELEELIIGLERFNEASSWDSIASDRFFYYKRYHPSSTKRDVFANGRFADKNIYKFRCGEHSQVRCFGYREEEQFYVLRIERDHRISDYR